MRLAEIMALPVAQIAARDAVLVLWTTQWAVHHALAVMAAWGFQFKTAGTWAKRSKTDRKWQFGTGHILRSAAEFYLIGARGRPSPQAVKDVTNLIVAPVRQHSRKPDELHRNLERMWPTARRLEMFATYDYRPGWSLWGAQVGKYRWDK
jgi:N6-adenosine-specific RNA methylase IME4